MTRKETSNGRNKFYIPALRCRLFNFTGGQNNMWKCTYDEKKCRQDLREVLAKQIF